GDQIRGVSRDPLGRHSAVTYVHRAVRARPYVDVQVEAERQRRAIKGAAQVRASRRHTDGDLLGHRPPRSEFYASIFFTPLRLQKQWKRRRSEEHTSELQSLAYLVC